MFSKNNKFKRNEGQLISSGQKLWRRVKRLFRREYVTFKRPELFLLKWPLTFQNLKDVVSGI